MNYSHMFFEDEDEEEVCAVLSTKYPSSIGSNLPCRLATAGGGVHEKVPNRIHCARLARNILYKGVGI